MNSPITGKPMKLVKELRTLPFRKEDFTVMFHFYLCETSGEQFTNDMLDSINLNQVYNKYRERYGIPFPDEIKEIREKYEVSASKMSEILGFGTNSYRLYEAGEIPSVSNGRLILAVNHPKDFIKQVEASSHLLTEKEKKVIIAKASNLFDELEKNSWNVYMTKHFFKYQNLNEYSGYKKQDFDKIAAIISYFGDKMELFKTKLNKLLFYTDFGYFQRTGFSMTGITYKAIQLGPVPAEYEKLFIKLVDEDKIKIRSKAVDDNFAEIFQGSQPFNESLFNNTELEVLEEVNNKFKNLTTKSIVNLSHEEDAWIDNFDSKNLISYPQYGFKLKHMSFVS